jgi:hypothetical protein
VYPVAQQRPGPARVDDLLDAEPFGGPQRAAHGVEPGPDFGQGGGRIIRALKLGSVGGLDPALDGQRAPVGRGPGPPPDQAVPVGHARSADPEYPPHDDLGTRRGRLIDGADRAHAVPDGGALLGASADKQPRLIGERHDRQVERRAQVGQPGHRLGALDGQTPRGRVRVAGHDADRMTIQAGQRGHD